MRIEKSKVATTQFSDLISGQTFTFAGVDYMKAGTETSAESVNGYNAVRLMDGSFGRFARDTVVMPTPNSKFFQEAN